ncbi:MAG TPA: hypothetical protein VFJ58_16625 [Armatimonadota bacterium]|nr:hypothetical protein [Armatimonadota bacterium]
MKPVRGVQLTHAFSEYRRFASLGEHFAAISSLAYADRSLERVSGAEHERWENMIASVDLSPAALAQVRQEAINEVAKLDRIVSWNGRYNDDEVLLVLTIRNTLELVERLLLVRFHTGPEIDTGDIDHVIDREFRSIRMTGVSRRLFNSFKRSCEDRAALARESPDGI